MDGLIVEAQKIIYGPIGYSNIGLRLDIAHAAHEARRKG
jgi:hypothetical protein